MKISFEEFSQETDLTIKDFDHDSPSINYIDVTVFDEYSNVIIVRNKIQVRGKEK